jgi:nucleotide-binding universal stress UspA family protein
MDTILYATDCNRNSVSTLNYAKNLSETLKAKLSVFHVYDIPPVRTSIIRSSGQLNKLAMNEQKELLEDYCRNNLHENLNKDQLICEVAYNTSISKAISDRIKNDIVDLLIIGMKDEHTARGFFSGNIANKLIDKNLCPILIIPQEYSYEKIEKIVYASDFESADIIALEKLSRIAEPYDAEIEVVHIPTLEEYAAMQQMEWFKELLVVQVPYKKISFHIVLANSIEQGLRIHTADKNADILAMLERENKGLFASVFGKDIVKRVENLVTVPILCYNS